MIFLPDVVKIAPLKDSFVRRHWTLDPNVVFLNHGSFGACPHSVLETQTCLRALMEEEPVQFMLRKLPGILESARADVASFMGADAETLAFVPNTTTGVSTVLRSVALEPGDELLVTDHAYNACKNAVDYVADRRGARVVVAPIPVPLSGPDEVVARIAEKAGERVRLALIDHVTSQTGIVFPIKRIVEALRERGIETLVDGAHAPGMVALDVRSIDAAYYVGNFHKWVCAPKGAAALCVRRDLSDGFHPLVISHGYRPPPGESRFHQEFDWTGTQDPTPWLCIPEAIRFVASLVEGGWAGVRARNRALALEIRARLGETLSAKALCPDEMIGSLVSMPLPDGAAELPTMPPYLDALQVALFDRHGIEVPVFPWPAPPQRLIRVSAHLYNGERDVAKLCAALSNELGEP